MVTFSSLFKKQQEPSRIGLALSGGGSKGFAHIGVLKAMEEKNIIPDIISGTSAGSLAGVLYADGYCPEEIVDLFKERSFKEFAELTIPQGGLFKLDRLQVFLKKTLRSKKFEDLKIPLKVVTTDLERGKSVVFDKGKIIEPILASCAYPIIFKPIKIGSKYYIDGGLLKNFPVSTIRKDCECIIGVNVNPLTPEGYKDSLLYVAERTFHYVTIANTIPDRKICNILIELDKLTHYKMFSLDNVKKIYEIGYQYAIDNLSKEENIEMLKKNQTRKRLK